MPDPIINIHDESADKKYFTMIPNVVIDNTNMTDLAVYVLMKRAAGETGTFCMGQRAMKKKLGVGHSVISKSIARLLEAKFIVFQGFQIVETDGGLQKVKAYTIADVWGENMAAYGPQSKGVPIQAHLDGVPNQAHHARNRAVKSKVCSDGGASNRARKKNPNISYSGNTLAGGPAADPDHQKIVDAIDLFKPLNPSHDRLFGRSNQRDAVRRMLNKFGEQKVMNMIRALPDIVVQKAAPRITTPLQLEEKLGQLILFVKQNGNSRKAPIY